MSGLQDAGLTLVPMTAAAVDAVWKLECGVFPYPWTRGNFADALASGYDCWTVRDAGGDLAGYYLLMYALDEAHLLDVALAGKLQRQGLGRRLLEQVSARA